MKKIIFISLLLPLTIASSGFAQESIDESVDPCEIEEEILMEGSEYDNCLECLFPPEILAFDNIYEPIEEGVSNIVLVSGNNKKSVKLRQGAKPVPAGKVISKIGDRRPGGRRHEGVDIGARMGSEIVAMWDGVAIRVGNNKRGGKIIKIKHANGIDGYYAHLKGFAIRQGAQVRRGQVIGYVGMSGNARGTTPHLHLELHSNGKRLNPLNYF